jgi:hypothetical protein
MRSSITDRIAMQTVRRRCLVCEWSGTVEEPENTDEIGPECVRCHAPTERIEVITRSLGSVRNAHAAALGRLGGLKGGPARTAALSPRRRRAIAQAAARARWSRDRDIK